MDWLTYSQEFLKAAKHHNTTEEYIRKAKAADEQDLLKALPSDAEKLTFWINLYNAFNLHLLGAQTLEDLTLLQKWRHFRYHRWQVGDIGLRLDDMEHGILRRGKAWWGLGYWPQLFPGEFVKQAMPTTLDSRIHFTLNCGATSCPPIRFYEATRIDDQLDLATEAYLESTVTFDAKNRINQIPKILQTYRGDFGGVKGLRDFIKRTFTEN